MRLKIIYGFLALGIIFSVGTLVYAHSAAAQEEEEVLVDPGTTPASPFHIFDRFGDWVRLNVFTFNPVRKAIIRVEIAEERLSELRAVVEAGGDERVISRAEVLLSRRTEQLENNLEKLDSEGRDIADLVDKFNDLSLKQQGVLERVFDRVPDQARDAIEHALERAHRGFEKVSEVAVRQIEKGYLDEVQAQKILERTFNKLGRQIERRSEALKKIAEELGEVPPEIQELFEKKLRLLEGEVFNVESREEFKDVRERIRSHLKDSASDIREYRRVHRISDEGMGEALRDIERDNFDIPKKAAEMIADAEAETEKLERNIAKAEENNVEIPERVSVLLRGAKEHLTRAKEAFEAEQYGEAFGQARAAANSAKNGNQFFDVVGNDMDIKEKASKIIEKARIEVAAAEAKIETLGSDVVTAYILRIFKTAKSQLAKAEESLEQEEFRLAINHANSARRIAERVLVLLEETPLPPSPGPGPLSQPEEDLQPSGVPVKPLPFINFDATESKKVTITDSGFNPKELKIRKGDTVIWTNESSGSSWPASAVHPTHRVYPQRSASDCLGSSFDACKRLANGESYQFKFDNVGSWRYHNHLRPRLTGVIIVGE